MYTNVESGCLILSLKLELLQNMLQYTRSRVPVAFPDVVDCREHAKAANAEEEGEGSVSVPNSRSDDTKQRACEQVHA